MSIVDLFALKSTHTTGGARLAPRSTLSKRPLMNQNWRSELTTKRFQLISVEGSEHASRLSTSVRRAVTKAVTPTNIARCAQHRIWWLVVHLSRTTRCVTPENVPTKKKTREFSSPQNWHGPYSQTRDVDQQRSGP